MCSNPRQSDGGSTQCVPQPMPPHRNSFQSESSQNQPSSFVSVTSQDRGTISRSASMEPEQLVQKLRRSQRREGKGKAIAIQRIVNEPVPSRRSTRKAGTPGIVSPTEPTQSLMYSLLRHSSQRHRSMSKSSLSEQVSRSHSMTSMETERPPPQRHSNKRRRDSNDSPRPSKRPKPSISDNACSIGGSTATTMAQDLQLADVPFHYGSRFNGAAVKSARILPFSLV